MELGGSDPFIVLEDADLAKTVQMSVASRYLINNGQGCICAKRFLVAAPLLEAFTKAFVEQSKALPRGDFMQEGIKLGPLARADLRRNVHRQVQDAVKAGARVLTGGEIPDGPSNFYPPTMPTDLPPEAAIAKEEFFWPVAVIYAFETEDKAVEVRRPTTARAKRRSATKSPELVKDNQSDPPYRIVQTRHKRAADAYESSPQLAVQRRVFFWPVQPVCGRAATQEG